MDFTKAIALVFCDFWHLSDLDEIAYSGPTLSGRQHETIVASCKPFTFKL